MRRIVLRLRCLLLGICYRHAEVKESCGYGWPACQSCEEEGSFTTGHSGTPLIYRVGRKVGRTIYRSDELIGMLDTPELAAEFVDAANEARCLRASLLAKEQELAFEKARVEIIVEHRDAARTELERDFETERNEFKAEIAELETALREKDARIKMLEDWDHDSEWADLSRRNKDLESQLQSARQELIDCQHQFSARVDASNAHDRKHKERIAVLEEWIKDTLREGPHCVFCEHVLTGTGRNWTEHAEDCIWAELLSSTESTPEKA